MPHRQINDRVEAWLYLGALAHLLLLFSAPAMSLAIWLWGRDTSLATGSWLRSYGWVLLYLLGGTFACATAFVVRAPNRRLRPVRALHEAVLVIAGRLPPVPPPPAEPPRPVPAAPPPDPDGTHATPPVVAPVPAIERPGEAWLYLAGLALALLACVTGFWLHAWTAAALVLAAATVPVTSAMSLVRVRWLGSHPSRADRREFTRCTRYGLRSEFVGQAIDVVRAR